MRLDPPTLAVATIFVMVLLGVLLLYAWSQNREVRALAWWGGGTLVCVTGMLMFLGRGTLSDWLTIVAANVLVDVGIGAFWGGFRSFGHRRAPVGLVVAGAFAWLAACGIPDIFKSFPARVLVSSIITSSYLLAMGWEMWRGRGEPLKSRTPILIFLAVHTLFVASRYPMLSLNGAIEERTVYSAGWVAVHSFEALMFCVAISFLLLGMTKERIEAEQRDIAARDPLTGTLNRRAFVARGRDLLDKARRMRRPCALFIADLDHFKSVNDRFGHAAGDDVLAGFSQVAQASLPPGALLARLGGEEFACLLPMREEPALVIAERIREALAGTRFETEREAFGATVSLGLATTDDAGHILDALLAAADVALYQAKARGRDRVESATLSLPEASDVVALQPERFPLAA